MQPKHAALLSLLVVACSAHAQSSVNIFGTIDLAARSVKNGSGGTQRQLATDGINSSQLVFSGTEDLGSGLYAGFTLNAGFNPDLGTTNTKFFNRRSTVSLISSTFGELRLGHDYDATFWTTTRFDPYGTNGVGNFGNTLSSLGSGSNTGARVDNGIHYLLPSNLGGVYGQLTLAPGEGTLGNRYSGVRLGIARDAFDVVGAYGETTVAGGNKLKVANIGASYDFNVVKLLTQIDTAKYNDRKQTVVMLAGIANIGVGQAKISYIVSNMSGTSSTLGYRSGDDARQIAVGYLYNLSKRTAVYGTFAAINNRNGAAYTVAPQPSGLRAGERSTGYDIGLRHFF